MLSLEIKHSLAALGTEKKLICLRAEEGLQGDCKIEGDWGASISQSVLKGGGTNPGPRTLRVVGFKVFPLRTSRAGARDSEDLRRYPVFSLDSTCCACSD